MTRADEARAASPPEATGQATGQVKSPLDSILNALAQKTPAAREAAAQLIESIASQAKARCVRSVSVRSPHTLICPGAASAAFAHVECIARTLQFSRSKIFPVEATPQVRGDLRFRQTCPRRPRRLEATIARATRIQLLMGVAGLRKLSSNNQSPSSSRGKRPLKSRRRGAGCAQSPHHSNLPVIVTACRARRESSLRSPRLLGMPSWSRLSSRALRPPLPRSPRPARLARARRRRSTRSPRSCSRTYGGTSPRAAARATSQPSGPRPRPKPRPPRPPLPRESPSRASRSAPPPSRALHNPRYLAQPTFRLRRHLVLLTPALRVCRSGFISRTNFLHARKDAAAAALGDLIKQLSAPREVSARPFPRHPGTACAVGLPLGLATALRRTARPAPPRARRLTPR